jgi:peptidoglycan-associated lipoprotein
MMLKVKHSLAAVALAVGLMSVGCTDDEPKVEEPVQPTTTAEPAPETEPTPAPTSFSPETVYFAFDDFTLSGEAQGKLDSLANHLKESQNAVVQVEGHCDERGSTEYNLALGQRRAQSVKDYLVKLGIDATRLSIISYGEEKPASDGHDESAWSKNRRAEFMISNN